MRVRRLRKKVINRFYSILKDLIKAFNTREYKGNNYNNLATSNVFKESGPKEN